MTGLRRLDAFVKTRSDLRQRSAVGGLITLVAASAAGLLFVGQLYNYLRGDTHQSLRLSRSVSFPLIPVPKHDGSGKPVVLPMAHQIMALQGKTSLVFHVTFTNLGCDHVDVVLDGASYRTGQLITGQHAAGTRQFVTFRKPTPQERKVIGMDPHSSLGCTVDGLLRPPTVAGNFQISVSQQAWTQASTLINMLQGFNPERIPEELKKYNVSHYIHKIEFGKTDAKSPRPLENRAHIIDNDFGGIAVEQIQVKLVPTVSTGFLWLRESSYQQSVVDRTVQPEALMAHGVQYLPGLVLAYDFVPLTVYRDDGRENLLVFVGNLVSIVAGVFVTVGLITGCLVQTVSEVAKKID
jgi:Endoplasmic reticulum vesicle transporter/Endoplasmic Reticulum-Golgi Intermediate Compartment (ERGIC)